MLSTRRRYEVIWTRKEVHIEHRACCCEDGSGKEEVKIDEEWLY